jgi:imidazolonepropionase-like amidohydrolase
MRLPLLLCLVASSSLAQTRPVSSTPAPKQSADPAGSIIIRADRVIDGRGHVVQGGAVVVTGDKISRVGAVAGTPTYDLKGLTLIPGLIDAHAHLTWYFNRQGRYHSGRNDNDTPVESMLSAAGNAYATLMAGFTTIQSPG